MGGDSESRDMQKRTQLQIDELDSTDPTTSIGYWLYLPWALVELDGKIRCAYEFGAPKVSLVDAAANDMLDEWRHRNRSQSLKCLVRTVGQAAKRTCVVALQPME